MSIDPIKTKAVITKIDGKHIYLNAANNSACASCSALCSKKNRPTKIQFRDGYEVGEEVYLTSDLNQVLRRSLLLYGLPLLMILLVALICSILLKLPDFLSALFSLLSIPATLYLLKVFYKDELAIDISKI